MSTKSNRSSSPLVFVRHPHSFVPLSGQHIPPPPNWKPPPLPKDVGDSSSEKSYQSSTKSKQRESVLSDDSYLNIPTISDGKLLITDTSFGSNPSYLLSTCVQPTQELKDASNLIQMNSPIITDAMLQQDAKFSVQEHSAVASDIHGTNEREYFSSVSLETNHGEQKTVMGKDVPDIKIVNDTNATLAHKAESTNILDTNNISTHKTITSSGNYGGSKLKQGRKKPLSSITISKLEEELDELPIPEFPSMGLAEGLDNLPMSEFPVPEVLNDKESQNLVQSMQDVKPEEKNVSEICKPINMKDKCKKNEESNHGRFNTVRKPRNVVNSMDNNLNNINNLSQSTGNKSILENGEGEASNFKSEKLSEKSSNDFEKTGQSIEKIEATEPEFKTHNGTFIKSFEEKLLKGKEPYVIEEELQKSEEWQNQRKPKEDSIRKPSIKYQITQNGDGGKVLTSSSSSSQPCTSSSEGLKPSAMICRIKDRVTNERRNSLVKTLTRLEPYLLVASSPPGGIRSQRLAELGVSCVVHAVTCSAKKGFLMSHSDGIDIINANLEDGENNVEIFDAFADEIAKVQKKKGVALVISDESSLSIQQR